jgi:hypothetical protein
MFTQHSKHLRHGVVELIVCTSRQRGRRRRAQLIRRPTLPQLPLPSRVLAEIPRHDEHHGPSCHGVAAKLHLELADGAPWPRELKVVAQRRCVVQLGRPRRPSPLGDCRHDLPDEAGQWIRHIHLKRARGVVEQDHLPVEAYDSPEVAAQTRGDPEELLALSPGRRGRRDELHEHLLARGQPGDLGREPWREGHDPRLWILNRRREGQPGGGRAAWDRGEGGARPCGDDERLAVPVTEDPGRPVLSSERQERRARRCVGQRTWARP